MLRPSTCRAEAALQPGLRRPGPLPVVVHDRIGRTLKVSKIQRPIELPPRAGRLDTETEAQCTCAVVRPLHQVVELGEFSQASVALDHAPPPEIRHRIPDRAEETNHPGRLVDLSGETELDRIEFDRIVSRAVRTSIHELADPSGPPRQST